MKSGTNDLFSAAGGTSSQPLAYRMRPRTIDEFVGQDHIVGPGRLLRRAIQADQLSSLILYGPPGTGKTTLARVIAGTTRSSFLSLNAVLSGVKEVRESIDQAKNHRDLYGRKTILFVDEVHRWNRAQQDALLPWVENGTVILIGATTENPYFEVNSALVSRSRIFQLKPLTEDDLRTVAEAALADPVRGYGKYRVEFEDGALEHLVRVSGGDARTLLNALELAVETTPDRFPPPEGETIRIGLEAAEESIQKKVVLYDKEGDYHFDTISAFIKSIRGSDPDAALYWLARMIEAGEDPRFILRRLIILASEDIGLANPQALVVAESAAAAFDRIGLPEGTFPLTQATLYLATSPKSNSSMGFFDALTAVKEELDSEVPSHLRDASRDKHAFGHGEGYLYPHAYRDHWVAQQYLPGGLQGRVFYKPSAQGYEREISSEVLRRREAQIASMAESGDREVLTWSPSDKTRDQWVKRVESGMAPVLAGIREKLFERLELERHDRVLAVGESSGGLLVWEAFRRTPEGGVWALVQTPRELEILSTYADTLPDPERPTLLQGDILSAPFPPELRFEAIVGRNALTRSEAKQDLLRACHTALADRGSIALSEVIPRYGVRLSGLVREELEREGLFEKSAAAEELLYTASENPLVSWSERDLERLTREAGFTEVSVSVITTSFTKLVSRSELDTWLASGSGGTSYGSALRTALTAEEFERLETLLHRNLDGRTVPWASTWALVSARKAV